MNCRFMRLIVFFDLPTLTNTNLKDYRKFRKFLLENGFIMMQESVYSKLVLNGNSSKVLKDKINKNLPPSGVVELMEITEKQFANITYLVGNKRTNVVDSLDRVVEI